MPRYWILTEHGETDELDVNCNEPTKNMEQGQSRVFEADRNRVGDVNWEDNHERYDEMIHNAFGIDNMETGNEEEPNPEAARRGTLGGSLDLNALNKASHA
ncbi:hypothetical protein PIB30_082699 [Stylosanthes scabra]|uniref:Uncharacterized protein n=1 Tax=Stylosanthes scabra TaxID=79078 RepID=A0ABU6ZQM8_9FABA|nr:hypothetical protein [Stylosanthes scabra]